MNDMMLKPCPFCGSPGRVSDYQDLHSPDDRWDYIAICSSDECPASSLLFQRDTKEEAIAAWNTRASHPAQEKAEPVAWAWSCDGMEGWALGHIKPTPKNTHKFDERNTVVRPLVFGEESSAERVMVRDVFRELVEACEADFCSLGTETGEPDDSKVSYPEEKCHLTFGHIRRARKALSAAPEANS